MLRIDETSKTLVAPEPAAPVADAPLTREELLTLLSSGWQAFAGEIGQPHLRFISAAVDGIDVLAFDETAGTVAVALVIDGDVAGSVGRAIAAAARVAGWDAAHLAEIHEDLQAVVPGESPRILLVGSELSGEAMGVVDWLVRRHGHEISAHLVQTLRMGSDRLMEISRAYPAPDPAAAAAHHPPAFQAGVASAPPPGVPAA